MEKKVELTIDAIYREKFQKDVKGYNPDQVDAFLDRIIRDYDAYNALLSDAHARIAALEKEGKRLRDEMASASANGKTDYERMRGLERENAAMRKKLESIKPSDSPSSENLAYINRINELEGFLYSEGYDPRTLKRKNVNDSGPGDR